MAASPLLSAAHYCMTITLCWKQEREQTEFVDFPTCACMHTSTNVLMSTCPLPRDPVFLSSPTPIHFSQNQASSSSIEPSGNAYRKVWSDWACDAIDESMAGRSDSKVLSLQVMEAPSFALDGCADCSGS